MVVSFLQCSNGLHCSNWFISGHKETVWQIFSYLVCFCVFQYLYSDVLCERSIRIYAFNYAVDLDCISNLFILEQITIKRAIMFTVLCVVDVYTHYGAVFVIIPMALQLLVYYWKSGEKKTFWSAMISYAVAGVGAGIPLLYFFMLPQSTNPISTLGANKPIEITGNNIILVSLTV